ncbi:sugar ABC transporter substrate-binding protein [Streptomyces canus]|uniref:sugar ABC transporter substrate-binding protein n=1 Tax=Streptomyces canus TaxID=58343 RepID=UPI0036AC7FC0
MGTAAVTLTACGSTDATGTSGGKNGAEPVQIAFIGSKMVDYQNAIFRGMSSVDGVKVTFIESGFDPNKQSQAMDNAVASGRYKGIVLVPNSATGLIPAAQRAIAAGIQVVNVSTTLGPDEQSNKVQLKGQAASIVEQFEPYAEDMAKLALRACAEARQSPCTIARIGGLPQYAVEGSLTKGVAKVVAEAGSDAKVVATTFAGGYGPTEGLKAGQDLLASHPKVNVVLASTQAMQGVEQAVTEAGLDFHQVHLIGLGGNKFGMKSVAAGRRYGEVAFFPSYVGKTAAETLLKHIADPDLKGETLSAADPHLPLVYTKKNADQFKGQSN